MSAPSRPVLRYLGGKWRLADWIASQFPPHRTYLEPFGGAASVLLKKPRANCEIYNDLDGDVVEIFRVLRDPTTAERLISSVALTPFAREEFMLAYEVSDDPMERCRRLLVRSWMGHGSTAVCMRRDPGFRAAHSNRNGLPPSMDWRHLPPALVEVVERLQGVAIEQRPALGLMARFDRADTLIYADPPYPHATRSRKRIKGALQHGYKHELSDADHRELLAWLTGCASMVVLSGYGCPLYDQALGGWLRLERQAMANGGLTRTEVIWINPAAQRASRLFGVDLVA